MTWLLGVAQFLASAFWLLTAFYALLASQPFAYEQFLRPQLVPAVSIFARQHAAIGAAALVLFAVPQYRHSRSAARRPPLAVILLAGLWSAVTAALFWLPPLSTLGPGRTADLLVFAALVPAMLVAVVDFSAAPAIDRGVPSARHRADFSACAGAALLATGISVALGMETEAGSLAASLTGIVTTGLLQLVLFAAVFLCLTAARAVAAIAGSGVLEVGAVAAILFAAIFLMLWRVVLPSLMTGRAGTVLVAAAFACAITVAVVARGLARSSSGDDALVRVTSALSPQIAGRGRGWLTAWMAALFLVAFAGVAASAAADWNFLISRLAVGLVWLLVLSAWVRYAPVASPREPLTCFGLAGLALALHVGWTTSAVDRALAAAGVERTAAVRQWAARDPSGRFLIDALAPPVSTADTGLFDFLQAHTNIPVSVQVAPVEVVLSPAVGPPAAYRPHIFLFVVDSLRRDYLGPYNREASFTPAIDALARDSAVFERAFTRYGATGLSVPSIWTGGMLLHKQYVTPFHPMNALAKLLEAQQYAQWLSMDYILQAILPASSRRVALDTHHTVKDHRFCGTLDEIRGRLTPRASSDDPVFAYSLPQDIHVSAIMRDGGESVDETTPAGFYSPVASRVRRFDRCFGAFVDDLKAKGLYDDSVIVLTSDHGDSLGEGGRMGHAYTLYPEIVQIPLIVRLPPKLSAGWVPENEGVVYTTDITPTLYALLGAPPAQPQPFFGRPLFRARGARPRAADVAPVFAASYGAVYASMPPSGRTLYVLDAVNRREDAFELDGTGPGRPVVASDDLRQEGQEAIRSTVTRIADFYRFTPPR